MKRREFLGVSCLAVAAQLQESAQAQTPASPKQFLELRQYQLETKEKQDAFLAFLKTAAIPAWNRLNIKPVGVFQMLNNENLDVFVLLPYTQHATMSTANAQLMADADFVRDGKAVLTAPMKDPVYKRYTSSLLLSFDQCPKLEVPVTSEGRIFQLRIYESHNLAAARRKIEMFNQGGEIALFRTTGLKPVFFGEALFGDKLPHLAYMLSFENSQAQKEAWDKFTSHADWKKMSSDPYFKDTVSNITNLVLKPAAGSQI